MPCLAGVKTPECQNCPVRALAIGLRRGRRLEIEADNVGRLGLEVRIVAGHVMTQPGTLQTGLGQHEGMPISLLARISSAVGGND